MSDRKKILAIVFVTILILAIGMSVGENEPEIRVTYNVVEDAHLEINIEGVDEGNEIDLYCPENDLVGSSPITADDITDRFIGVVQATVEVPMTDEGNPSPGDYRMVVSDHTDEEIYEDEITFEGPDIEITDVGLDTEYEEDSEKWEITSVTIDVENEGDLSIFLSNMDLTIGEHSENIEFEQKFELMPDENVQVEENISVMKEEGDHSLNLELYSFGEEIVTHEAEVTIG